MHFSLPNVNKVGKYHYHRHTGKRILGIPGTSEYLASYLEAEQAERPLPKNGSFEFLLLEYAKSAEFKRLAKNTKRLYQIYIQALRERFGETPLKDAENRSIRSEFLSWRDELITAGKAATARNLLKFAQTLFAWGEERAILDVNRLAKMKQVYQSNRAENTWEPEQIAKLLMVARPEVARAVIFALFTGQRQGDLCKAAYANIQGDALIIQQQKTGAIVGLPLVGKFGDFLTARDGEYILLNSNGDRWEESSLRQAWRAALVKAKLDKAGLRFHDLRGTTITTLADMGATEAQMASISGHSIGGQAPTLKAYLRKTNVQARAAMELLNESWIGGLDV